MCATVRLASFNAMTCDKQETSWFNVSGDDLERLRACITRRLAPEETVGPEVSLIPCQDTEDAIDIANDIQYGLSSAIYTRDVNKAFTAMRDLYAGITYINAPTIGAEVHLPFGGVKATGNGHREGGFGAIEFYTEWKSVYVDYSDKLQKAQIDRPE